MHKPELNRKFDRFTLPMYRRLWYPAIISAIGWAIGDIMDAIVVGNKLGITGLAAISLVLPVYKLNFAIAHGFGIGGSMLFCKNLADGKPDEAKTVFSAVIKSLILIGVLLAVSGLVFCNPVLHLLGTVSSDEELFNATRDYYRIILASTPLFFISESLNYFLRNDNEEKIAGIGCLLGVVVDVSCNILFVIFFEWGTAGAALSTAIGFAAAISVYCIALVRKNNHLSFVKTQINDLRIAFGCFRSGFSTSIRHLYNLVFLLLCNNLLISLSGEAGVAIFDIVQNVSFILGHLYIGTANAMQPLVSTYHFEHNLTGMKTIRYIGFLSGSIIGLFVICLVMLFPEYVCRLFGLIETGILPDAEISLRIYASSAFFSGINIMVSCYLQDCEQEKAAFFISSLRGLIILIPSMLLMYQFHELKIFWLFYPITEILTLITFPLFSNKYKEKPFPDERIFQKTIFSDIHDINHIRESAEQFCIGFDASPEQCRTISLTMEEVLTAILKHGFKNKQDGYIEVIVIAFENGEFELHIRDNAVLFNPFSLKLTGGISEDTDFSAVGMEIIRNNVKSFFYRDFNSFNTLMIKV